MSKKELFSECKSMGLLDKGVSIDGVTVKELKQILSTAKSNDDGEKESLSVDKGKKASSNSSEDTVDEDVSDVVMLGVDINPWRLLCKSYSEKDGWMKSTKALDLHGKSVLVKVTTQQGDNVSEALTTVEGRLVKSEEEDIWVIVS